MLSEQVILDLGRLPEARYQGEIGGKYLRQTEVIDGFSLVFTF